MSRLHHGLIVVVLMAAAGALLVWKSSHAAFMFADGLRYISQARQLEAGGVRAGLLDAIDHPVYPAGDRRRPPARGGRRPAAWQRAAQLASVLAGLLLVLPLYLVAVELVGGRAAWMACVMAYLSPTVLGRAGRRAERGDVPPLLDLGPLGGPAVPPRRPVRLAGCR